MDTMQCAIVLAKLDRFDWEVERRREIGARYDDLIDSHGIRRVQCRPDRTSVYAQYTVFVDDRTACRDRLRAAGIPTAVHYPVPLNEQPVYEKLCCPGCTPLAAAASRTVMSLPMSADLDESDQGRVVVALASHQARTRQNAKSPAP